MMKINENNNAGSGCFAKGQNSKAMNKSGAATVPEIRSGLYVFWQGSRYRVQDSDCTTCIIESDNPQDLQNGFADFTFDIIHKLAKEKIGFRCYRVVDKSEISEAVELRFSAVYCNIRCERILAQGGFVRLIAYSVGLSSNQALDDVSHDAALVEKLKMLGFAENRKGSHGNDIIFIEKTVAYNDPDLQIIAEQAPALISRTEETYEERIARLADILHVSRGDYARLILKGLYKYSIPCHDWPTDMEAVVDKVIPMAYRLCIEEGMHFQEDFILKVNNAFAGLYFVNGCRDREYGWVDSCGQHDFPYGSRGLQIHMQLMYLDLLLDRARKDRLPCPIDIQRIIKSIRSMLSFKDDRISNLPKSMPWTSYPVYFGEKLICNTVLEDARKFDEKFRSEYGVSIL